MERLFASHSRWRYLIQFTTGQTTMRQWRDLVGFRTSGGVSSEPANQEAGVLRAPDFSACIFIPGPLAACSVTELPLLALARAVPPVA